MADRNIEIKVDVDYDGVASSLAAVASQFDTAETAISSFDNNLGDSADGLADFSEALDQDFTPELDLSGIENEIGQLEVLADSLEKIEQKKSNVTGENESLNNSANNTADGVDKEAKSMDDMLDSAESLTDVKRAVTRSNKHLNASAGKSTRGLVKEAISTNDLADELDDVGKFLDSIAGKEEEVGDQSRKTAMGIDEETRSFEKMIEGGSDLEDVKHAVANSNKRVQNESGKSTETIIRERVAMGELDDEALRLIDTNKNLSKSNKNLSQGMARAKERSRELRKSFRAATEVGDLFEDGLGALSLNVGAFTIALRNFLTQVPLIITGLGAIGSAALAAAASVSILTVSLLSLLGAGLFAQAQRLKEEFSQIEETGQALQVIMQGLFDVVGQAAAPLMELEGLEGLFNQLIEGLGFFISVFAEAVAQITVGTEEIQRFADESGVALFTIQDAIDVIDGSSLENLAGALQEAWVLLGEETVMALAGFTNALSDAIRRSTELFVEVEDLGEGISQFTGTISELAEIGFLIGGGLLPVFKAFSSVVETAGKFVNGLDEELVQNAVTFAALILATNKVLGVLGSFLTVLPSVSVGFATLSTVTSGAAAGMASFGRATIALATGNIGALKTQLMSLTQGFRLVAQSVGAFATQTNALSGFTALIDSVAGFNVGMNTMAFTTEEATEELFDLALDMKMTNKSLDDMATSMSAATGTSVKFSKDIDDLQDELRELAIQGELTDEAIDDIGVDRKRVGKLSTAEDLLPDGIPKGKNLFGGITNSVEGLNQEIAGVADRAARGSFTGPISASAQKAEDALDNMSASSRAVATATGAAAPPTSLLGAATQALNLSTIKTAFAQNGLRGALKSTVKMMGAAILQTFAYIGAQLNLVSAELSAAGATVILDTALTSLTGGLSKVLPAIIAFIVAVGALAYGVISNMDGIKGALSSFFEVASRVLGIIADLLMDTFIATWDALVLALGPVLDMLGRAVSMFSDTGGAAKDSAGLIDVLAAAGEFLGTVFRAVALTIGTVFRTIFTVFAAVGDAIFFFIDIVAEALASVLGFGGGSMDVAGMLVRAFENADKIVRGFIQSLENGINATVDAINSLISAYNSLAFVTDDVSLVEEVKLAREEAEEGAAQEDLEAQGNNNINYNVDNSTNIDQAIDADPEDSASLSRVVEEAIRQANSFERRRAGSQ